MFKSLRKIFLLIIILLLFSVPAFAASERPEVIYARGYGALFKGNYSEAQRVFERGLKGYPDSAVLYDGLGDAYLKEGNYQKAAESYQKANHLDYYKPLYKVHYYNAFYERAKYKINMTASNFYVASKNSTGSPCLIDNIFNFQEGNYNKLQFITDFYVDLTDDNLTKGNDARFKGNFKQAIQYYNASIVAMPTNNYKAYNNIGVLYLDQKDYQGAISNFKKAIELNKNSVYMYSNLGVAYFRIGNYKDAYATFDKAIEQYPSYSTVYNNKAVAEIFEQLYFLSSRKTASDLEKIIDNEPNNVAAKRLLMDIYTLCGCHERAALIADKIEPSYNFDLLTDLAFVYFKNGNCRKAKELTDKAMKLYSTQENYLLLARIADQINDPSTMDYYETALLKSGKRTDVCYYYGKYLAKIGKVREAKGFLKQYSDETNLNFSLIDNAFKE